MWRCLQTLTLALVGALLMSGVTYASHQGNGHGSPRDFAVGTGMSGDLRGSFAAHGGPSPFEPVSGHFRGKGELVDTGPPDKGPTAFKFEGPVTCLQVEGNRAGLIYPIKNADPDAFEGQAVYVFVEDNGNPSNGDPPDRVGFLPPQPLNDLLGLLGGCPADPTGILNPFPVEKGNITVHDAVQP